MLFKWLPWKYLVRRMARSHGFLDPFHILSRLQNFAQPSEVGEPIELLRAGLVFHARGLMNTRTFQNNLDWVWPYWVERQFNPRDVSFIPRAFSISHINLSHRNWTAVGLPDLPALPIVDPSGLVTPFFDGWSLDAWVLQPDGKVLVPSKSRAIGQTWELENEGLAVETVIGGAALGLRSRVEVLPEGSDGMCRIRYTAASDRPAWLAISLRPCNPEGVSFVDEIRLEPGRATWSVDGLPCVHFSEPVEKHVSSEYHHGDVYHKLLRSTDVEDLGSGCKVGLATGAALFSVAPGKPREITLRVDLSKDLETARQFPRHAPPVPWPAALDGLARLTVPDPQCDFLYRAAVRTLLLHSPGEVFPGPYTYKRFWFRDAAFILNAMLAVGMRKRVERALDRFTSRQTLGGYFLSQEGEWDSNGEALWILARYYETTGEKPKEAWRQPVIKAAEWIIKKRMKHAKDERLQGLMPAGFSAEHLGPNDYYYWDDFWGVAGLEAAASLLEKLGEGKRAAFSREQAADFSAAIDKSLEAAGRRQETGGAVPASPLRRMDSGAIGSLAASYPLNLWPADDSRMAATLDYLLEKCMFKGGFFQEMIHSGINAYLTLHMAQALLRAGDPRFFQLVKDTAALASPTGQWPEAIHPHTLGGCMGDGQHVWAACEWVQMMRNLFIREEGRTLILASGIPGAWIRSGQEISFGPGPSIFGEVTVSLRLAGEEVKVNWTGNWHSLPETVQVKLPGRPVRIFPGTGEGSAVIPYPLELSPEYS